MGTNFVQPCASCGREPEEFRIVAGTGLRCTTPHCPVHPAVTARTPAHALTVWNLSQQPLRPDAEAENVLASNALDQIRDIVLGLRDDEPKVEGPRCDREPRLSIGEIQRLKDLFLHPAAGRQAP